MTPPDTKGPSDVTAAWREELAVARPRVAKALLAAEARRASASKWKPAGARLSGLEELLNHLDQIEAVLRNESREEKALAYLVHRCTEDFEAALEGGHSGYFSVAADSMRDVMEITDLVLLFSTDFGHLTRWIDEPVDVHWKMFAPMAVRRRLHAAGVKYVDDTRASVDYKGHSAALHVTPRVSSLAAKGIAPNLPLFDDGPFWEMFTHGRELVHALDRFRRAANYAWPGVSGASDLLQVEKGYEKSKEMEKIFMALLGALQGAAPPETPDPGGQL